MKEWYGFDESEMDQLEDKGITIEDLFRLVKEFNALNAELSKVSLLYYVDNHGDFLESERKGDIVAQIIFEKLPVVDKIEVATYIEEMTEEK